MSFEITALDDASQKISLKIISNEYCVTNIITAACAFFKSSVLIFIPCFVNKNNTTVTISVVHT